MALSPMMQQYWSIKEQHKDQIVFYRLGDFYEMFFEDAILASRELDLTLTGRDCGEKERAPMCGVPHHSCEAYIQRLIEKGYKVAICEQMEDPATAKGVVKREVVRVITPGTIMESNMLDEGKNNFLCSIYINPKNAKKAGIAFSDISTGEIHLTQLDEKNLAQKLVNEVGRFVPRETIANKAIEKMPQLTQFITERIHCMLDVLGTDTFDFEICAQSVLNHFSQNSLEEMSLSDKPEAVIALGAFIAYLHQTQKSGLERVLTLNLYQDNQFMNLDPSTRRNLELCETMRTRDKKGSLLWVLDKTKTAMGKRLMRKYIDQPLINVAAISKRLAAVGELVNDSIGRVELVEQLDHIYDLERLMTKVVYGNANARDLRALADTCGHLPHIKTHLEEYTSNNLSEIYQKMDPLCDIQDLIDQTIVDDPPISVKEGGIIRKGVDAQIDELRDIIEHSKDYLTQMEAREREQTGIKNLKIGFNRVFGYYIEVTRSNLSQVPSHYIRKQTLTGGERYITEELKDLEQKILTANEKIVVLEFDCFDNVRKTIAKNLHRIQATANYIATLDVYCSFAQVAAKNNYCMPVVDMTDTIQIEQGRHPVVELMLGGAPFVENDTLLDCRENCISIITGPNMAGKSTYMRQTAIITLMAQIGSFVPAKSAHIGVVDGIYTRVGATDDLALGQSTFMVEMNEVAYILKNATRHSLLILDEIGRGTSTYDGMSIARSVVEYIADKRHIRAKTLFATHYHELTELEDLLDGVKNYNVAVKKRGDDITFLRRIVRGGADESYGIEVSKLAGIPDAVIVRAKEILQSLESTAPTHASQVRISDDSDDSDDSEQVSFASMGQTRVVERLKQIDINTLSPIEALQTLYELTQMV